MLSKQINDFLTLVDVSAEDPSFYGKVFSVACKLRKKEFEGNVNPLKKAIVEEYGEFSRRIDRAQIQDSSAVRNVLRSRALANMLINDKGEFEALYSMGVPGAILGKHTVMFEAGGSDEPLSEEDAMNLHKKNPKPPKNFKISPTEVEVQKSGTIVNFILK